MKASFSASEARRIALNAQGFNGRDRDASPNWGNIRKELNRLHLLQIDSVNVLVRSHYLPLFSRSGNYDRDRLDRHSLGSKHRELFECWAHEASLVRMDLHPLMRWRMDRARRGQGTYKSMDAFGRKNRAFLKKVLSFIETNGPTAQSDLPEQHKGEGGWWGWSKNKMALETLFDQGLLTTTRRDGFERIYDIPERVIPQSIRDLPTPPERDAMRQLMGLAGAALGIGTEFDLRDYFRLPVAEATQALNDAVEEGTLVPVRVEGWKKQGFLYRDAKVPRNAAACALVSPFDPICWYRDRAERLFGFHYRIELYTPAPKRKFGYYVLPFLHGDRFAARVCLKSDRQTSTLLVNQAHIEGGCHEGEVAEALLVELRRMANWLGLEHVKISSAGNLSPTLLDRLV